MHEIIENLVGRMHQKSGDSLLNREGWNVCGVAKEGCLKFNPRPGRGLNPEPSGWQSEILPTVPTSHTSGTCGYR